VFEASAGLAVILLTLIHRSNDPTSFAIWCVIGFCAGIGLFLYGFRLLQRRRLILDTPFSKIRSASMGMVEVSGLAAGPYTMIAPITGRPCYYYRTQVWEWKQEGKNKTWVKVAGERMHVPFFVDDNTGRLLVDPRGAEMDLHCDFSQEFSNSFFNNSPAPPNVVGFLARRGISTMNKIKVEEACIKPKNALFILGTLAENPGLELKPEPIVDYENAGGSRSGRVSFSINSFTISTGMFGNNRDASLEQRFAERFDPPPQQVRTFARVTGSAASQPVNQRVADAMLKAGISNPPARAAAGLVSVAVGTGVQVARDPSATADTGSGAGPVDPAADGFDAHPRTVLMRGENNKTFLISWRSQREVAQNLGWKSTLMIWGGPVLALLSLYFFLSVEHLLAPP